MIHVSHHTRGCALTESHTTPHIDVCFPELQSSYSSDRPVGCARGVVSGWFAVPQRVHGMASQQRLVSNP